MLYRVKQVSLEQTAAKSDRMTKSQLGAVRRFQSLAASAFRYGRDAVRSDGTGALALAMRHHSRMDGGNTGVCMLEDLSGYYANRHLPATATSPLTGDAIPRVISKRALIAAHMRTGLRRLRRARALDLTAVAFGYTLSDEGLVYSPLSSRPRDLGAVVTHARSGQPQAHPLTPFVGVYVECLHPISDGHTRYLSVGMSAAEDAEVLTWTDYQVENAVHSEYVAPVPAVGLAHDSSGYPKVVSPEIEDRPLVELSAWNMLLAPEAPGAGDVAEEHGADPATRGWQEAPYALAQSWEVLEETEYGLRTQASRAHYAADGIAVSMLIQERHAKQPWLFGELREEKAAFFLSQRAERQQNRMVLGEGQ